MAETFRLQQLLVSDESSFALNAETPSSATWANNLPFLSASLTLDQDRIPDASHQARLAEQIIGHMGPRRATLNFQTYWMGHHTTAAGALTKTWQYDLLQDGLGGVDTAGVGTTIADTSTATSLVIADGSTFVQGAIVRVGAKGDGRGDGQAVVDSSVSLASGNDTMTLLTALPAAPNASDVVYSTMSAYHDEDATLVTKRFAVMHATTGAQYFLFGGQLAGLKINIPLSGGLPTIDWTYEFAYWQRSALSFPNATALEAHSCAPVAGGSLFINDVATATRATIQPAEITINYELGLDPIVGPGGVGSYQQIVGWARTNARASIEVSIPWVTTYETWWDTANQSLTYKHMLLTANAVNGRSVGFYAPRVMPTGQRPSGVSEVNGQNYVKVIFGCREGPDTTNDMSRAAVRFFAG